MSLHLEINEHFIQAKDALRLEGINILITPPLNEEYWRYRVKLYEDQAILGFPKFGMIAIGFAQEEDWNTNLPSSYEAQMIYDHIKHNKKYEQISDEDCLEAIRLIQQAVREVQR